VIGRLVAVLGLIGCFSPHPPEGAPCASSEHCPPPQQCVMGTCQLDVSRDAAVQIDAPAPDAAIDAPMLPCDLTGFTCGTGAEVFMCGTQCFARCNALLTNAAASTRCQGWSGKLAEIPDAATNACVTAKIAALSWIGLTQSATATTPAAGWSWNNATPVTFTSWHAGQPDDADGVESHQEQCGTVATDGTWDDQACGFNGLAFVCQH
jgi:hypothetical protein